MYYLLLNLIHLHRHNFDYFGYDQMYQNNNWNNYEDNTNRNTLKKWNKWNRDNNNEWGKLDKNNGMSTIDNNNAFTSTYNKILNNLCVNYLVIF